MRLMLTAIVEIPEDLFAGAEATLKVRAAWEAFTTALKESGLDHNVQERRGRRLGSRNANGYKTRLRVATTEGSDVA